MPYYFKPVVWNSRGYRRPSGVRFNSGFPKENGYGHEEWNNAPQLTYEEGPDRFKVFHTEGLGNQNLDAQAGLIALMLIASDRGSQFLVGVAAGCVSLMGKAQKQDRLRLAQRLGLDSDGMAEEAWSVPRVRTAYEDDRAAFQKTWNKEFHWIPNWTCPADLYLPLFEPVRLDPMSLTGKKRLIGMYGAYQSADAAIFQRVLSRIPASAGADTLERLRAWAGSATEIADDIKQLSEAPPTMRAALVQARRGQGAFRAEVMSQWQHRCAVTGCGISDLLRASHIRPWSASDNAQRLDGQNGLMLAAHLDALFDRGLITFAPDGAMLVAEAIREDAASVWGIGGGLRNRPSGRLATYLAYHRDHIFVG